MKNNLLLIALVVVLPLLYACANNKSLARVHPEEVKGMVNCAECHTDAWAALNHQAIDFYLKHRYYSYQYQAACYSCHQESYCADCHAHKEEIKPSDKYKDRPELALPHRGDYLSQHRIDGRVDPVSCFKCHGRENNERCKTCHR